MSSKAAWAKTNHTKNTEQTVVPDGFCCVNHFNRIFFFFKRKKSMFRQYEYSGHLPLLGVEAPYRSFPLV